MMTMIVRSLFLVLAMGGMLVCGCEKSAPADDARWQNFNKGIEKDRDGAQAAFEKRQAELQKKRDKAETKKAPPAK